MRRILCIVIACIMATVFMSASDVSALTRAKIETTHWDTKVVSKRYDSVTGQYEASGIGQGITDINITPVFFYFALFSDIDAGQNGEISGALWNYTFNETTNKLKSIDCQITVYRSNGTTSYSYSGDCTAKIKFTTNKRFVGTITFTDAGVKHVITLKGKKLGNY